MFSWPKDDLAAQQDAAATVATAVAEASFPG
jgi:hypothetical protein